jgi:phage terminase large subunit
VTWRRCAVFSLAVVLVLEVATLRRWREDPVTFVRDNFQTEPDAWQVDLLRAFANRDIQRISLQACAGPGKSAALAWCGWNFLSCYADEQDHPNGAAVSITQLNLRDNLWKEFAKWQSRSPYLSAAFTWTAERIFQNGHPGTWFLSARSWPKTASPEEQGKTLSGLHGRFVLALADESGAIPLTVARAAEQALSTRPWFGKILQAGNPISLDGMLYSAAVPLRDQWHVIVITGDPDDPKRSPRIDIEWARQQIKTYGRDNPWVKSYLLGQFPPASINALLGPEDVEAAMSRHLLSDAYDWAQKRLGIDVARYGDDRTVIFPRQGLAAFRPIVMRHARHTAVSVDIANRVMDAKLRWSSELEFFDATGGWAAGAVDVMRANGHGPIDVQFASTNTTDPTYYNRRAEIWFGMAKWIQSGAALPPIPELVAELITPTYTFHAGKFLLEDKDMVKKRLGRSPDLADALALTFGLPDMPAASQLARQRAAHALTDADPFLPADTGRALADADPFGDFRR